MTWLTVNEYLCHKLPRICFVCRNDNPIFSSLMTFMYHRVCNQSNTIDTTCGTGTAYTYGAHAFIPGL